MPKSFRNSSSYKFLQLCAQILIKNDLLGDFGWKKQKFFAEVVSLHGADNDVHHWVFYFLFFQDVFHEFYGLLFSLFISYQIG